MPLKATSRWKEEAVIEDEEQRAFVFECAWGVEPLVAYLPSVADWETCVPSWLWGRRDEVVRALETVRHIVQDGPYPRLAR